VEEVGVAEQASRHRAVANVVAGRGKPLVRVEAGLYEPGAGQVEPSHARVLADVAGDVGQLHRDAEVAGAGDGAGVAHAHDQGRQHVDAGGVVSWLGQRRVLAAAHVLGGTGTIRGFCPRPWGAAVGAYRGIEHATERQGARHVGQEGDAQG